MAVLPPGTLLQLMYLRERLRGLQPGHFVEIGPGSGEITGLLLDHGWSGISYELEAKTVQTLRARFANEIAAKRFIPVNESYLLSPPLLKKVDMVISCMVMEHLEDDTQYDFMGKSANCLKIGGVMIGFVPASPEHWGIEDDIAGHFRRYSRESLRSLLQRSRWKVVHVAGLTYPVSNLLLPISNFLVRRNEVSKLKLSIFERTKQSGRRNVRFKTHFPSVLKLILNEWTMLPLYWIQKLFSNSDKALVIYFEAIPESQDNANGKP
jgi:hypothetical protein